MYAKVCNRREDRRYCEVSFAGNRVWLDASGALYLPEAELLVVADLHFEKGSFLAQFAPGVPRYDTCDTLRALEAVVKTYQPREVICLGDSFHDMKAAERICSADVDRLQKLVSSVEQWHWICGNHDPEIPAHVPGESHVSLRRLNTIFLHEPEEREEPQVVGHYHPKLRLRVSGQRVSGRCFLHDSRLMVMPSFGSFTGGLDVQHEAIAQLYPSGAPECHLLYGQKIRKINYSAIA